MSEDGNEGFIGYKNYGELVGRSHDPIILVLGWAVVSSGLDFGPN